MSSVEIQLQSSSVRLIESDPSSNQNEIVTISTTCVSLFWHSAIGWCRLRHLQMFRNHSHVPVSRAEYYNMFHNVCIFRDPFGKHRKIDGRTICRNWFLQCRPNLFDADAQ